MKTAATLVLLYMVIAIAAVAGYITNIIWIFQNMHTTFGIEHLIALIGVVSPLGFLHGIYLWF